MKRSVPSWQLAAFVGISVLGTLLHFLFDLTGGSVVAALFSAVNESIWEHMKLIYYPMLLVSLVEYRAWGKERDSFWPVKLWGLLIALVLIPSIYYLYTGALGMSTSWFNVATFFIAAAAACRVETRLFVKERSFPIPGWLAFLMILLIGAAFVYLTFFPAQLPLFRDPLTGTYGFSGQATRLH